MTLHAKVKETLVRLGPRLDELADGYVELESLDEARDALTIKIFGGRMRWCGMNALSLWAEKLIKEELPEIKEVNIVDASTEILCAPNVER